MNTARPAPAKLDVLDGLRGIAVLSVILFHHRLECDGFARSAFTKLLMPTRFGWIGVHLFLVLSGFCLTRSLLRRQASGRPQTLKRYYLDRWRRIAPAYYAAIGLYLAFSLLRTRFGLPPHRDDVIDTRQIASHVLFIHGLWHDTIEAINSPFWSLSLEFQFYAILPLIFALAARFGVRKVVSVIVLGTLAWRAYIYHRLPDSIHLMNGFFLGRVAEFGFGILAASWYETAERRPASAKSSLSLATSGAFLILGGLCLPEPGRVVLGDPLIGLGWVLVLISVLGSADSEGWLARRLSGRLIVGVGAMSYSLYLTHSLCLSLVDRSYLRVVGRTSAITDLALFLVMGLVVSAVGALFYLTVERRFLRSVDTPTAIRGQIVRPLENVRRIHQPSV